MKDLPTTLKKQDDEAIFEKGKRYRIVVKRLRQPHDFVATYVRADASGFVFDLSRVGLAEKVVNESSILFAYTTTAKIRGEHPVITEERVF